MCSNEKKKKKLKNLFILKNIEVSPVGDSRHLGNLGILIKLLSSMVRNFKFWHETRTNNAREEGRCSARTRFWYAPGSDGSASVRMRPVHDHPDVRQLV